MGTVLELRLLGGFAGQRDGAPLSLPTRKAWGLLAYLALHPGRELRREHLATLLWGDRLDEQARRSLRQELYEIRRALGEGVADRLKATTETVVFDRNGLDVDVLRFENLAHSEDAEALAKAETLYQGPLLDGLEIGEADFEEWLSGERSRLHGLACSTLEKLTLRRLDNGDAEASIETARRLLKIDPLREEGHRLLMRGLAKAGRRSEALTHYQDLEALLKAELGVEPETETADLRDAIRAGAEKPAAIGSEPTPPVAKPAQRTWLWVATVALVAVVAATVGFFSLREPEILVEKASEERMAYPLPDKPSIAVLPFENLSDDPEQDLLANGLTEDLITALSKVPRLFVIARTSILPYKGKPAKVQVVAEALGVRYIVEGSVQKSGDKVRVTAQLIDAIGGHHLWGERFDRKPAEIFDMQDEIVKRILVELEVKLTAGDHARVASRGTNSLEAWLLRVQTLTEVMKFTRESTLRARQLALKAHEADPNWSRPLGAIAWSYWWEARKGWSPDREEWIRRGVEYAERAIAMDPMEPLGYMQLGNLMQIQGDHGRAVALREKAVEVAPNDFLAMWGLGSVLYRAGQPERGVEILKRAERSAPLHPASLLWTLAQGQLLAGHYEDAIHSARRASVRAPDRVLPYIQLTIAYSALGRMEEARAAADEVLRIDPKFTVSGWTRMPDYRDRAAVDKLATLLLAAALPE